MLNGIKVLSIAKALPLQLHPNKALSAQLHAEDPQKYTDDNHKPEIAIALGPFEVFAGFKPNKDIQVLVERLEPLKRFLPEPHSPFDNESVKALCRNILGASDETIKEVQQALQKLSKDAYGNQGHILALLPRLQEQYSIQDPGNLVALLCVPFLCSTF